MWHVDCGDLGFDLDMNAGVQYVATQGDAKEVEVRARIVILRLYMN